MNAVERRAHGIEVSLGQKSLDLLPSLQDLAELMTGQCADFNAGHAGLCRGVIVTVLVMAASTARPAWCHHAGLGQDLQGAVDLEVALYHNQFPFFEPTAYQIMVTRPGTQHYFSAFKGRFFRVRFLHIHHGTGSCDQRG